MARKCVPLILLLIVGESLVWAFCPDDVTYAAMGMGGVAVLVMAMLTRRNSLRVSSGAVLSYSTRETNWRFEPAGDRSSGPAARGRRVHAVEISQGTVANGDAGFGPGAAAAEPTKRPDRCPGEDKILRLCRVLPALPPVVFDAFTRPELLLQWWAAGEGCTPCLADVDLRVDGEWRLGMRFAGRPAPHVCKGEYRQVAPSRLIFTWAWESPTINTGITVVCIELTPQDGGGTRLDLSHRYFWEKKHLAAHSRGWEACLDRLEQFLGQKAKSAVA